MTLPDKVSQLRSHNAKQISQISDGETRGYVVTLPVEVSPLTRPAVAPDMCLLRIDPLARPHSVLVQCTTVCVRHSLAFVCGTHWHDAGVCGLTKFQTVSNSKLKTALCCCAVLLPAAPECRVARRRGRCGGGGEVSIADWSADWPWRRLRSLFTSTSTAGS